MRKAGQRISRYALAAAMLTIGMATDGAAQAPLTHRQIEAGLALLPEAARAGAELRVLKGAAFEVLREGSNGWSCRIWTTADRLAANCHQSVLIAKLDLERKLNAEGLNGAQVREHQAEMLRTGSLSIPRGSMEISGSGQIPDGGEVPPAMAGYYFVYFPFETTETLGLPSSDPGEGRPWLHHGGTADAHIMWPRSSPTR